MESLLRLHPLVPPSPSLKLPPIHRQLFIIPLRGKRNQSRTTTCCSAAAGSSWWEKLKAVDTSLSDVVWPSAGAFLAMAVLGKMDQIIAPSGLSLTVAPLGAVSTVLFATPAAPGARKYNMFMAQIGCAAFGILALYLFGPGWLARSTALAASVAFMIITRSIHPPAAALPIMFIDGAKFHSLHLWYILFPGATGCLILCLIVRVSTYETSCSSYFPVMGILFCPHVATAGGLSERKLQILKGYVLSMRGIYTCSLA